MIKMLIDCDTGIDDSIAILFALKRPDVRVLGITTGCGNIDAYQAAENSIRLIHLAKPGYEVPVAVGANAPLVGPWEGPVPHIHGANGVGNAELLPADQKPAAEAGWDMIVRLARENPGELTVVTLGRMTNLALALEKEPALPRLVKNVVAMGGAVRAPGNVSPVSEANIAGDPEAADRVFLAGFDLTLVGIDVTGKTFLTPRHLDIAEKYWAEDCRPILDYMREALKLYFAFACQNNRYLDRCPVHDPLAMVVAVDPSVVTIRKLPTRVKCGGTLCRGMVVSDFRERPIDAPFASICLDVDSERAVEELLGTFLKP